MGNPDLDAEVRQLVLRRLYDWHRIDPAAVAHDRALAEQGVNSRDAVTLAVELAELAGVSFPATLLWEVSTLDELAQFVCSASAAAEQPSSSGVSVPGAKGAPAQIAVVGVGCRLPGGVTSAEEFWRLLADSTDAVTTLPEGRWEAFASDDEGAIGEVNRHGGFLDDLAAFDAEFFGITPNEAAAMDPQQRLLLEVTHESLDHAAISARSLAGTRTGVFIGISGNEYAHLTTADLERVEPWTAPGAALSIAANRLSYVLDVHGPSHAVDTACSSSLVAVHHAVQSLASGESDTAVVGGVNILLSPAVTIGFQRSGVLAPDGRCKTFDAAADGMVRSEGCAVVVLKRLADAEASGDRVLAVIQTSAVNSDGRSNGLLAPNAAAQRALLAEVYERQGVVAPIDVDYVEAHGTGTELGDPVEAGALGAVLGRGREPDWPLLVGSVKTNLGHLEAAAGIVGLIKTVLALHHGEVPPSLHFARPNDHIDFNALALRVVTSMEPWPRYSGVATAGVSAFGFGGTNAHVVLQEYVPANPPPIPSELSAPAMLTLDAATPDRLRESAAHLAVWLHSQQGSGARLEDVAHTLAGRAGSGKHRAAVVARTAKDAAEALSRLAASEPHPAYVTATASRTNPRAVWVFSGYGSQWPGMARRLLAEEPAFAAAVDELEPVLERFAHFSLRNILESGEILTGPSVAQPVLFGVQVALASLWRAHGLQPGAVIGHSMGEIAAGVVAGALPLEAGAQIIAARSRLLDGLSGGAMAVVSCSEKQVEGLSSDLESVQVAVHSSPEQVVVAGTATDIERLISRVESAGGTARPLDIRAASHTCHVDPVLEQFTEELGIVTHREPACRFYATASDDPRSAVPLDAAYWVRNLRNPVRFRQAVTAAAEDGYRVFVEVSPHPTQLYPLAETLRATGVDDALLLPTLRRGPDETSSFRLSLASLMLHGETLPRSAWRSVHTGARIIDIPSTRWRHERYWTDVPTCPSPTYKQAHEDPVLARPVAVIDRLRFCVAQVMGYAPANIDDGTPLTDLGLDSLQAARIVALVKRDFGIEIAPRILLNGGNLARLAARLNGQEPAPAPTPGGPQPRDMTERLIAHTWQEISGRQVASVNDELEELAQNSPLASEFARRLSEAIGQPIEPLGDAVTVAALADRLRHLVESATDGPMRVLRANGHRLPLFLIHPAGGSTAVYQTLCRRLDPEQPCFGLERLPHLLEVSDRAAEYARLIREMRPAGPWAVGGWSYGGIVAQETARLLAEHGEVSALVLIDSVLPLTTADVNLEHETLNRFAAFAAYVHETYGVDLDLPYDALAAMSDTDQIEFVIEALRDTDALPPAILKHQHDSYIDVRSGERHHPATYSGRTILYRATAAAPHTVADQRYRRDDQALGWDEVCTDLSVTPVPGHHLALLDPPVVDVLGRLLRADLADRDRPTVDLLRA